MMLPLAVPPGGASSFARREQAIPARTLRPWGRAVISINP